MKNLFMLIAAIALTACAPLTPRCPERPSALTLASCPELSLLHDDSFGATAAKLVEVAGQYHQCRAAALAQ